ncbi:protein LEAD-SENSITIVE 1-like [Ziziphus jujuba]|uniref:Protein LEAD-SENSITIVE 1-like n=1 Tax=Ziziphus jujuba TaxID=326968 RepID=A0A6P3ZJG9_ZIZJJ|nr:protein LEAD-SENSITIVE 1-like [Ziziphus jujuba]
MGLISNRVLFKKMLQPGDHIYCYRNAHSYSHHGIFVEEDTVIHFTRTDEEPDLKPKPKCRICGYHPNEHRGVVKTCLKCFLDGNSLFRYEYEVSKARFVVQTAGACSTGTADKHSEVIKRATEMLETNGFGKYVLLENNCETFAVYCKTGKRSSMQAVSLKASGEIASKNLTEKSFSVMNVAKTGMKVLALERKLDTLLEDLSVHDNLQNKGKEVVAAVEGNYDEIEECKNVSKDIGQEEELFTTTP